MKILFITNDLHDALNSRVNLKNWVEKTYNFNFDIAAPVIIDRDFSEISLKLKKRGINFSNIFLINRYIKSNVFDTIIFRGIENILLSLFIRNSKRTNVVFFLTGLGKAFSNSLYFKVIIRAIYKQILKLYLNKKNATLIVQNIEDANDLGFANIKIINGSGVPIKFKKPLNFEYKTPTIITATRLNNSKGLNQIIELSEKIIKRNLQIKYYVLGDFSNLKSHHINKILELNKHSNIFFEGFKTDLSSYFSKSHFAYYPTRYREGVPRFLIESLSNGLVLFTNSMPGCSLTVSNNNGFLNFSTDDVLNKIIKMKKKEVNKYSENSRVLFESVYSDVVIFPEFYKIIKNND